MSKERVGISAYQIAIAPTRLVTYGLGSCLGIVLYDPDLRLGGLAHTLLPTLRQGVQETRTAKFVDSSIEEIVAEMVRLGAEKERIWAKIVGGANMFEPLHGLAEETVGARNIRQARETLERLEIPLLAEDVGGNYGRTVEFVLETGEVRVRSVRGPKPEYSI